MRQALGDTGVDDGMSGFVVLEGIDGGGKTTLAEELVEEYGGTIKHVGPPRSDMTVLGEHLRYVDWAHESGRVVFDRFHLGTYAYQNFRPEKNVEGIGDFYRQDFRYLEEKMYPHCLLVLCTPPITTLAKEWEKRRAGLEERPYPEYERDVGMLEESHRLFQEAFHYSTLRKCVYDYTEEFAWQRLTELLWEYLGWSALVSASSS